MRYYPRTGSRLTADRVSLPAPQQHDCANASVMPCCGKSSFSSDATTMMKPDTAPVQPGSMLTHLERIEADSAQLDALVQLFNCLRPKRASDDATPNVRMLCQLLKGNPRHAWQLRQNIVQILAQRRHTSLYTDIGVHSSDGFFTELMRRATYCILPPALDDLYLSDAVDQLLAENDDYVWISSVPIADWLALYDVLAQAHCPQSAQTADQPGLQATIATGNAANVALPGLLESIRILSYRICAIGLEPKLIRIHTDIEKFESPFLMQNIEVNAWLQAYMPLPTGIGGLPEPADSSPANNAPSSTNNTADARHLLVMLDQCTTVVAKIRKNALSQGTSISLTYLLVALNQSIDRLQKLLFLVDPVSTASGAVENAREERRQASVALGLELIEAHNKKYALRELFANNVNLLARNVTENASRTGEHYIAENRSDYWRMLKSASGAGAVISVMAMLKILASYVRAAPLAEAFLYSMNYSFGFMLIHVLHFTVATKQPAMTAATIAAALHSKDGRNIDIESMTEMIVKVLRTQFVAVLGNIVVAMPLAWVVAISYAALTGHALVSPQKALHLLHDIDPFNTLALWYAAIAGVCLFVAGLISGYYDNNALYTRMAQRVMQLRLAGRILGQPRLKRLGLYLENNLGSLMGNFWFGVLLGCMGTLGSMLGLALDIRHITFSAANFATASVGLSYHLSGQQIVNGLAGVLLIGSTNLLVSFSLALWVALRSRQARFNQAGALIKSLGRRFIKGPRDFFVAPADIIPDRQPE